MDLFKNAKSVRLRTIRDKYLTASEDEYSVHQDRHGLTENSLWKVEFVEGRDCIRLRSCYGKYLTASETPFLPGPVAITPRKVVQVSHVRIPDAATEWEPVRDGMQVRLRTPWGSYLRPHRGLPPWRNSVTHEAPHRNKTLEKVLWDVYVVESTPELPRSGSHRRTVSDSIFSRRKPLSVTQ